MFKRLIRLYHAIASWALLLRFFLVTSLCSKCTFEDPETHLEALCPKHEKQALEDRAYDHHSLSI